MGPDPLACIVSVRVRCAFVPKAADYTYVYSAHLCVQCPQAALFGRLPAVLGPSGVEGVHGARRLHGHVTDSVAVVTTGAETQTATCSVGSQYYRQGTTRRVVPTMGFAPWFCS